MKTKEQIIDAVGTRLVHLLRNDSGWNINERTEKQIIDLLEELFNEGRNQLLDNLDKIPEKRARFMGIETKILIDFVKAELSKLGDKKW